MGIAKTYMFTFVQRIPRQTPRVVLMHRRVQDVCHAQQAF